MMHPITMLEVGKGRQRDLLQEAEASRMAHQAKAAQPAHPGPVQRIAKGMRTLLIEVGDWSARKHRSVPHLT